MPGRHSGRAGTPLVLAGALAAVAGLLTGCGSAVQVTPAPRADTPACQRVSRHWPATVGDLERVPTTSDSPAVAAWGDPAVIARCGVTSPGPTTHRCVRVSGVDWVIDRLSDGVRFVSYGRDPAIEVLVPHDYAPEPLLLPAFREAARQVDQGEHHCT